MNDTKILPQKKNPADFGIEDVFFLKNDVTAEDIRKLHEKAVLTLDGNDDIVQRHCADDMILLGSPSKTLVQKYLQYLHSTPGTETSLRGQSLDGQKAVQLVKGKKFILVTHRLSLGAYEAMVTNETMLPNQKF